jgi:hypothetical protein
MKKNKKDKTKYKNTSKKDQLLYNTPGGFFKTLADWYFDLIARTQKIRPKKLRKGLGIFFALIIGWGGWHKIYEGDFLMGITYGTVSLVGGAILIFCNVQVKFLGVFSFFLPGMGVEVLAIYDALLIALGTDKKYK